MLIDIRNQQQKQLVPCLACGQARWFRPWVGYRDANYAVEVYRCSTCGLGQLLPPPTQEKLDQFYDADYGAYQCNETDCDRNLDALRFLKRWMGTPRGPTFLAWLKLAAVEWAAGRSIPLRYGLMLMLDLQSKVLDYGCGAATDLRRFSEIGFSQLYGFDIRENSRARSTLPRVDFRYGRLLADARYETGFFDLIMLNHVLEHIPTPLACLNEVVPLLKSGGYMMVAVPNIANWYLDLLCRNIMH